MKIQEFKEKFKVGDRITLPEWRDESKYLTILFIGETEVFGFHDGMKEMENSFSFKIDWKLYQEPEKALPELHADCGFFHFPGTVCPSDLVHREKPRLPSEEIKKSLMVGNGFNANNFPGNEYLNMALYKTWEWLDKNWEKRK